MSHPFLQGQSIHLRAIEQSDLTPNYLGWLNDESVCSGNSHAVFPNSQKKMLDYFETTRKTNSEIALAIVSNATNRHIGNVSLQNIDWISRSAAFAILIGDKDYWSKGIGLETGRLMLNYAFQRLNLNRVYCGTYVNNTAMQKLALCLHMQKEGIRRQAAYKAGRYLDIVEYGVLREEFEKQEPQ